MVTETSMDAQTPANSGAFGPSASETVARSPTGRQPTGWRTGRIAKTFFLVACGLIFGGGLSFLMAQFRTPQPEPNTTVQTIPAAGRIGAASLAVAAEKRDEDDAAGLAGPPLSDNALTAAEPKTPARVPQTGLGHPTSTLGCWGGCDGRRTMYYSVTNESTVNAKRKERHLASARRARLGCSSRVFARRPLPAQQSAGPFRRHCSERNPCSAVHYDRSAQLLPSRASLGRRSALSVTEQANQLLVIVIGSQDEKAAANPTYIWAVEPAVGFRTATLRVVPRHKAEV